MFMIKAIVAAVMAGAGATATALTDGHVDGVEYCTIVGAVAAALAVVYAAPRNTDK